MSDLATKEQVNYRQGDEETNCGSCINFSQPDKCTKVAGVISLAGLSDLYVAATPTEAPMDETALMSQLFGGMPNG